MHPIAFHFGSLTVHWYGVMMAVAFAVGLWTASRRALLEGVPGEKILDSGLWLIVGAIVGARALYVISYWQEHFAGKPIWEILMLQKGGLVYYGGLIGASLGYIKISKIGLPAKCSCQYEMTYNARAPTM